MFVGKSKISTDVQENYYVHVKIPQLREHALFRDHADSFHVVTLFLLRIFYNFFTTFYAVK